jgi:dimethylhistidine N-methyltransferase
MFYDEVGSRLFDRITTLPEYYPTRTEYAILTETAPAIMKALQRRRSQRLRIVELGAGTASKTGILLEAALCAKLDVLYVPLDVSAGALNAARKKIERAFPQVLVEPNVVNYVAYPPHLEPFDGPTLMLYLGSSIGNFSPEDARLILQNSSCQMRLGDALLLGVDLVKDESTLLAAYDDSAGVTAAFNRNILYRLNKELSADFDPRGFRHVARWNPYDSRIEMHLECTDEQHVSIPPAEVEIDFVPGESIHTENSYKFTSESIATLFENSGFAIDNIWKDTCDKYAVVWAGSL